MATIHPFLWFDTEAQEARDFYLSVFKNARARGGFELGDRVPGSKTVPVGVFDYELEGLRFTALNAGPRQAPFNERISFYIETKDQAETDYFWEALTADGGSEKPCGWLTDKFGVYWQVIPEITDRLMADPDREKADRVKNAMYKMSKIIVADLEAAYAGKA